MPREFSAGAVIFRRSFEVPSDGMKEDRREGQGNIYYLLLHYESKHWDFAKGHIEKNETDEETVKREVEEETGIKDLEIIPGFKSTIKYFFRQYKEKVSEHDRRRGETPWVFKLVKFYLAQTWTKEVRLSPEHTEYKWLLYKDALKLLTHKNAKNILKKADEFLKARFIESI